MTISELIAELQKYPQELEIWRRSNLSMSPDNVVLQESLIYLNSWPDEDEHWEIYEATSPGRCKQVKRVAILILSHHDSCSTS